MILNFLTILLQGKDELSEYIDLVPRTNNPIYISFVIFLILCTVVYISYKYIYGPLLKKHKRDQEEYEANIAKLLAQFLELDPNPIIRIDLHGIPIFRQHNTQLFYFFLILGLSDPINFLLVTTFSMKPGIVHSIAALLLFYSINVIDKKLRLTNSDFLVVILFLIALFFYDLILIIVVIHILILFRFIQTVILNLHKEAKLSIFYLILIFYELTIIVKILSYLSGTHTGILFFYLTAAFQILIATFFTIFKENNPRLILNLKS